MSERKKKKIKNASFDWKESFSMPSCGAALHNGDCCGWEQGELITLLSEACAALRRRASFRNDKHSPKEHGEFFFPGVSCFAGLNHRKLLSFLLCFLHTWPKLEPGEHQFCVGRGKGTGPSAHVCREARRCNCVRQQPVALADDSTSSQAGS